MLLLATVITVAWENCSSWFERDYDARALGPVTAIAKHQPGVRIFAEEHFSDWLLWHDPALADTFAYKTCAWNCSPRHSSRNSRARSNCVPRALHDILSGYGLLLLEPSARTTRLLPGRNQLRVILRGNHVVVAVRSRA